MKQLKVTVVANAYNLTGDRGKISFKWSSNMDLPRREYSSEFIEKLEGMIANEIENHCLIHETEIKK